MRSTLEVETVTPEEQLDAVAVEVVARSRAAQGLPPHVESDAALRQIVDVVMSAPLQQAV